MSIFQGVGNRGGNRGGKDQFNWDDVRGDKYKEYYLGSTTKLRSNWWLDGKLKVAAANEQGSGVVAKNAKGKQVLQPAKMSQQQLEEIQRVKKQEEELMMEALGIIPKKHRPRESKRELEKHEFKELLRRGNTERDETDISRVSGLGYATAPSAKPEGFEHGETKPSEHVPEQDALVHVELSTKHANDNNTKQIEPSKKSKKEKKHKKEKKEKKHRKEKKHKKERHDSDDEPRRKRHDSDDESSHKRRRHDSDNDEPKRRKRHDSDNESSHRKKRHDSDLDEPRRRHDSDDE